MVVGLVRIFGLSARLTGGGSFAEGFVVSTAPEPSTVVLSIAIEESDRSPLEARGVGGRLEALLECCEMSSRTFAKGVLSTRSGDLEELRSKKVRGGDRGDSTLTEGVNCGEDCKSMDMGRLWPGLGGESVPLVGVLRPP